MSTSGTEVQLQETIAKLNEEKERLVEERKYLEADKIKKQIEELKKSAGAGKAEALKETQMKERQELQEDYESERKALIEKWNDKIQDFVDRGKKIEDNLIAAHNKKMEEYISKLTNEYPRIRYSTEYLNGIIQESYLVKQERYKEAQDRKNMNDRIQNLENLKYETERTKNINKCAENLGIKQEQDLNVLRTKLARAYDLYESQKEKDLEKLSNKYKNKKNELEGIQKKQLLILSNPALDKARQGSNELTNMILMEKRESQVAKEVDPSAD